MEVISTELFKKLTEMAKTDKALKKMLIESNQETIKHKAFSTNTFRTLEVELYQNLNNYLEKLSDVDLAEKDKIKNGNDIVNIIGNLIPTDNEKLGELMLDFNSHNLTIDSTSFGGNIHKAIEFSLYTHLKDFAYKAIDSYERVDF